MPVGAAEQYSVGAKAAETAYSESVVQFAAQPPCYPSCVLVKRQGCSWRKMETVSLKKPYTDTQRLCIYYLN